MLAAQQIPDRIRNLIMVCPSPCYLNDLPAYAGGFEKTDLVELLDLMDKNYLGWANYLAPLVIGSQDEMFSGELA
ncbi:sigma factor SigB regulation protein RsbQ, partial [Enterococcus faecium]